MNSLNAMQYALFSDPLFADTDTAPALRSAMTLADLDNLPRSAFALIDDAYIAALTEGTDTEALPIPPAVCTFPGCGDTFTCAWYRPGTGERLWSCGTASCESAKGVAL